MTEIPAWIIIITSILIPLLLSIPGFIVLFQNRRKQDADEKRNLSDEAIELYDRMKGEAEELRAQIVELREQCDNETKMRKELEDKFDSENEKYEELQTVVYILQSRQKSYEKYITKLVRQLRDNSIEPAKRPVEIDD